MKRILVLAALALVLSADAWVVVSTWRNRSDAPGGTVDLTERELRLLPLSSDSTAVLLELRWQVNSNESEDDGAPAWLNATKLQELGFDCSVPATNPHAAAHYNSMPAKELFVVLEFDSEATPEPGHIGESRLVAVDVGRDAAHLRAAYPNTSRHLITRGVLQPFLKDRTRRERRPLPQPRLSARIQSVMPRLIFVPHPLNRVLQGLSPRTDPRRDQVNPDPRYVVTVSWGTHYEPWVRGIRLLRAAHEQE